MPLFGLPGLRAPADCARIARAAARRCAELAGAVAHGAREPGTSVLRDLDGLSATVCRALDTFELARNVHPDGAFVDAADGAYAELGAVLHELNTDARLHTAVCAVLDTPSVARELGAHELRFARAIRAEFEHDGAHLPAANRAELRALHARADAAAAAFAAGAADLSTREPGVWVDEDSLRGLAPATLRALPRRAVPVGARGISITLYVPPVSGLLSEALRAAPCADARRTLFERRETLLRPNLDNLEVRGPHRPT